MNVPAVRTHLRHLKDNLFAPKAKGSAIVPKPAIIEVYIANINVDDFGLDQVVEILQRRKTAWKRKSNFRQLVRKAVSDMRRMLAGYYQEHNTEPIQVSFGQGGELLVTGKGAKSKKLPDVNVRELIGRMQERSLKISQLQDEQQRDQDLLEQLLG